MKGYKVIPECVINWIGDVEKRLFKLDLSYS